MLVGCGSLLSHHTCCGCVLLVLSLKGPRESEGMGAAELISVNSNGMDNS
jgi:hypothetical protein